MEARLAVDHGDLPAAREHLDRAERLRPRCTEAAPFYGVQIGLELIRARTALMDLSLHTVKTQAISIYRKFGVSSRSGAIRRAQDLGLLLR